MSLEVHTPACLPETKFFKHIPGGTEVWVAGNKNISGSLGSPGSFGSLGSFGPLWSIGSLGSLVSLGSPGSLESLRPLGPNLSRIFPATLKSGL